MYIVVLIGLLAFYIAGLFSLQFFKNIKVANLLFALLTFVFYIPVVIVAYTKNGFNDWNFLNTLPTANVSPFMFTICLIICFLPTKIKKPFLTLISLLSLGMILSPIISIIGYISRSYAFHFEFVFDFIAHFVLSLWGIYLVKTKQTFTNLKGLLASGSIIVGVALVMVILNIIFDQSFFGLSLNGKHNIYGVRVVENSCLSAFIYFIGLILIEFLGFFYSGLLSKITLRQQDKQS